MADAIFDASGNVAGNGGGLQAWSGAGALASILPSATSGISTSLPALLSGDNELTRTARSLPRYTYPEAKRIDYAALAEQIAAKNSSTSWDGGDIGDLARKLNAYNTATNLGKLYGLNDAQKEIIYNRQVSGNVPKATFHLGDYVWGDPEATARNILNRTYGFR